MIRTIDIHTGHTHFDTDVMVILGRDGLSD